MKETHSFQRTKNPCKLCGKKVSRKNGIQCKGKCRSWVHFSCLHYDDQKINDIKAGIIKIICPCPACTSIKNVQATCGEPKNQIIQCQKDPFTTATQHNINQEGKENKIPLKSFVINEEDSKDSVYMAHSSYDDILKDQNEQQLKAFKRVQSKSIGAPADENLTSLGSPCTNCHPTGPFGVKTCCEVYSTSISSLDIRPKKRGHSQSLLNALENVCHTVGILSNQIRELLGKMGSKQTTKG